MTSVTSTAQLTGDYPTAFDAITWQGHRPNIAITFGTENQNVVYHACGERTKCDDMFSRFDKIRACNGRTDGHFATTQSALSMRVAR